MPSYTEYSSDILFIQRRWGSTPELFNYMEKISSSSLKKSEEYKKIKILNRGPDT
jgi:hypothetical protein